MKTINIFVASSNELKAEREMLGCLANSLNTILQRSGLQVIFIEWENLDSSKNDLPKQEEYNKELRNCDICILLFWTKIGEFTDREFHVANEMLASNPQKKLYVYFKESEKPSEGLVLFRDSLYNKYQYFYCTFSNNDTLKAHFILQFLNYYANTLTNNSDIDVRNGQVYFNGEKFINLKNVPFVCNNEEYNILKDNIHDLEDDLTCIERGTPRYEKKMRKLLELRDKIAQMEHNLWDTALLIAHLSAKKCSERLKRAMILFSNGDLKGTLAILNEDEIEKDIEQNLSFIKMGEKGRKGIQSNIEEYELKIRTLESEMRSGCYKSILKLQKRILELEELVWKDGHENIVEANIAIASTYEILGDFRISIGYKLQALSIRQSILGNNHPKTASLLDSIGSTYRFLTEYDKALDFLFKALYMRQAIFGNNHPSTAYSLDHIGGVYADCGYLHEALNYRLNALDIVQKNYGEKNIEIEPFLNNVGCNYQRLGLFEEALEYMLRSLSINQEIHGDNHPNTANAFNNIGGIYIGLKRYENALEYLDKALEIRQYIFVDNHPDIANTLGNICSTYTAIGERQKALEYGLKSLEIFKVLYGEDQVDTARGLNKVGVCYKNLGDYDTAIDYLLKSYAIQKKILGDNHPYTANTSYNLGVVYAMSGFPKTAQEYFSKGRPLFNDQATVTDHPDLILIDSDT